MKNVAFFSIPAYGHTNPMLPVARELVKRENNVRFYSFDKFKEKIKSTGAEYISCDRFLPEIKDEQLNRLKKASAVEMILQDIQISKNIDSFIEGEFKEFNPDVIFSDSVCFWGKLNAEKHQIPMVVSNSTLAFNRQSSKYMKRSLKETAELIFGLPIINRELKSLKSLGYEFTNFLDLIKNDNNTDTVVYTSSQFQPSSETFSEHYKFIGPSLLSPLKPDKEKERPMIYVSLGTVINDDPKFYEESINVLKDLDVDVVISCGEFTDLNRLKALPGNIKVFPFVDQLQILSKADIFITHSGMNSVSESLFMATPMILLPKTAEQKAVARRVKELGAGILLSNHSENSLKRTVKEILENKSYQKAADKMSADFRSCSGPIEAARFIESVG